MNQQLALNLPINIEATFSDFCWRGNALLKQQLESILTRNPPQERFIYLFGAPGSGKSHLLQACCTAVFQQRSAIYLPMQTLKSWHTDVMERMEEHDLICIDDIDAIAKDRVWEETLFHLYNRVREQEHTVMIMSAQHSPLQSHIELADLRSRLAWGWVFPVNELDDDDKMRALQSQAQKRGFILSDTVAQFMLNRYTRNMHDLHHLLDQLDEASLAAQRKITIPFVKAVLER